MSTRTRNQFVFNQNTKTTLLDGYVPVLNSDHSVLPLFSSGNTSSGGTWAYGGSAGAYTLTLDQPFNCFLDFGATVVSPSSRSGLVAEVVSHNVTAAVVNGIAAKTVNIVFLSGTTPTELPADAAFSFSLLVKDSAAKPGA